MLRRRGFIVFVVMIVIVMISLAGLSFVVSLSLENKAVHRQGDQLQLDEALASGVELLKAFCGQSVQLRQESGGTQDNAATFGNLNMAPDGSSESALQVSIVAPHTDGRAGETARFGLENESARLHLGVLAEWERQVPDSAAAALLQLPGMTESTAAAILDWIDADGDPRPGGAETEYYAGQGLPYEPRNGVPALLEELLLIRDVGRQSLLGADADLDLPFDSDASRTVSTGLAAGRQTDLPWGRLLTVYSAERNTTADGKPRINLNERDLSKLHAQLTEALDQPWADFVIAYRQFGPADEALAERPAKKDPWARAAKERGRMSRKLPNRKDDTQVDLSVPAKYDIECILDLVGAAVALPAKSSAAKVEPDASEDELDALEDELDFPEDEPVASQDEPQTILFCPLDDNAQAVPEELPRLVDLTTTTDQPVLYGRVNINEAPRCVLLGVPGLDAAVVDRILSLRETVADASDLANRNALWLLTENLVDRPAMKALWPYVTGGGDVFRAQIVARRSDTGRTARAEVVVDGTVSPPRQVYWKNVTLLEGGVSDESSLPAALD
ncbi:MAG TPA: type II secretion system protein GspK [Candidatus Anammoximicrobium sp.]|nr:type II secretion system protein GspK [Candidatus Anammoximicrobium sp.]